jgi:hypothetical protein
MPREKCGKSAAKRPIALEKTCLHVSTLPVRAQRIRERPREIRPVSAHLTAEYELNPWQAQEVTR